MLKSKTMGSIIGAVMIVVTMAMPVLAAEPTQKIDYTEHSFAELDLDYVSALLVEYLMIMLSTAMHGGLFLMELVLEQKAGQI
ncbi:hypothetical protein [Brassicibacter mesophilus]|uniref:hypothetical protein n=1 Tax=Brassicibacter mesophilus TaxID=745119 RepID=UPI003D260324